MSTFLDLRAHQTATGPAGACRLHRGRMLIRDPKAVDTIGLHQTAVNFGVRPYQVKAAGGDALLAQFMRAKKVHSHVTAFDEGTFAFAYPLLAYVNHGNGMNPFAIALEGEGLFDGMPVFKRPNPSDILIDCMRDACTKIVEEAAKEGAEMRYVDAHRQHSADRGGDPGWYVWREVAIEHCVRKLGLATTDRTTRKGRTIPESWFA